MGYTETQNKSALRSNPLATGLDLENPPPSCTKSAQGGPSPKSTGRTVKSLPHYECFNRNAETRVLPRVIPNFGGVKWKNF